MQLSQINDLLTNVKNPNKTKLKLVKKEITTPLEKDSYGYTPQGSSEEYSNIYEVIGEDNLYLKLSFETDSYGDNDSLVSIQFVKAKQVTVSSFEKV
jgi:hypothetical protein